MKNKVAENENKVAVLLNELMSIKSILKSHEMETPVQSNLAKSMSSIPGERDEDLIVKQHHCHDYLYYFVSCYREHYWLYRKSLTFKKKGKCDFIKWSARCEKASVFNCTNENSAS